MGAQFELIAYPDAGALAQTAAVEWLRELESLSAGGGTGQYCVALAGGRIARRFFAAVVTLVKENENQPTARPIKRGEGRDVGAPTSSSLRAATPSWGRFPTWVHFFWGDERCVPPQDPESNFGLAQELLLDPLRVASAQIHRIPGEEPPATAAALAQTELCRFAPLSPAGQPVLDLVFLGMGEDGHVASLFPGESPELRANPAVFRPVVATKPPPHRITLGYPAIIAARQVWVLASGSGKLEALRRSLAPEGQTPLARVLQARTQTRVFTDITL